MTETQHDHVQRDLAALQAAEKKLTAAIERSKEAKVLEEDARRAANLAHARFHGTVAASDGGHVAQGYRPF